MVAYHAFPREVDNHIVGVSTETTWYNETRHRTDVRYLVPAEMTFAEGRKVRGVIAYTMEPDGKTISHRFFSERS